MLLQKVGEPPDEAGALGGRYPRPGAALEGAPRCSDRGIDIGLVAGRDLGDDLLGRGVPTGKVLPLLAANPFAVDQELQVLGEEGRGSRSERRLSDGEWS